VSIFVGGAGITVGNATVRQMQEEHRVSDSGRFHPPYENPWFGDVCWQFHEKPGREHKFKYRALLVDTDVSVCNFIRSSPQRDLYAEQNMITCRENASRNFARGYFSAGNQIFDEIEVALQRMIERCANIQGFFLYSSCSGGTGSGLCARICNHLNADYRKKSKVSLNIFSSLREDKYINTPYNELLSVHNLLDDTDLTFPMDNESLWRIIRDQYRFDPTYDLMNRIAAKVMCAYSDPFRLANKYEMNNDLNALQSGLIPFPRLHFWTAAMAPQRAEKSELSFIKNCYFEAAIVDEISNFLGTPLKSAAFDLLKASENPENYCIYYPDFDSKKDTNMAYSIQFRGSIDNQEAKKATQNLKMSGMVNFLQWTPAGYKIGLSETISGYVNGDPMRSGETQCFTFKNNVAIRRWFNRIGSKCKRLFSKRAYVHWYLQSGMEEMQFNESLEDFEFLNTDYQEVSAEQGSDIDSADADEYF